MMIRRREFVTLLGGAAAAWPVAARAQRPRPRIAFLSLNSAQADVDKVSFVEGLRALGHLEGQNTDIDYRYASGDTTRLAALARELFAAKPNVALANTISPAFAIKSIAPELPIVCPIISDAAVPRLAASYARPGGSVTGVSAFVEGLYTKTLELALDMVPNARRIGLLTNPTGASMGLVMQQIDTAAQGRGVAVKSVQSRTAEELTLAFESFANAQVEVVIVAPNALFTSESSRIARLALSVRLPTIFAYGLGVETGGLASYGVDRRENFRRAAVYVDKILKGSKPGDLPIEFPTKLLLVVNLKTANALGITIPATIVGRADEIIE
jgi:putative ABC transport system substrate-binding protein